MQATTTRPKITATADGEGVVSHAGSRLLADVADRTTLTAQLAEELDGLRKPRARHDPGRVLVDMAVAVVTMFWPFALTTHLSWLAAVILVGVVVSNALVATPSLGRTRQSPGRSAGCDGTASMACGDDGVMATPVLAFDVNETLLDLAALDTVFDTVLGDAGLRQTWFASMLQLSFVGGLTGRYLDFTGAQRAALRMTAARAGRAVSDADVDQVVGAMSRLPAHAEVPAALGRLRAAGFRLTALTNSVLDVATAQLTHAGLIEEFEAVFSADEVAALKPAAAPYLMVAERCGVAIGDVCLVAAHAWDVSGALAAGCRAAFVGRSGAVPSPVGEQPAVLGADLTEVADALIERYA